MNTLETIIEHGLSVRQIPRTITHWYEMRHHKKGNTIVRRALSNVSPERYVWLKKNTTDPRNFEFNDETKTVTRIYTQEITIPKHAGWWMCKMVLNTSSRVEWSYKTDHLAPTLEESVSLFLDARAAVQVCTD